MTKVSVPRFASADSRGGCHYMAISQTALTIPLFERNRALSTDIETNDAENIRQASMENTLGQADAIKQMGFAAGPIRPEVKFPSIAAHDIGAFAGDALARLDFAGQQVQELHGQRDLSYGEITSIIGKAIGKPDLNYVTLTPEQFRETLIKYVGMSESSANLLTEMVESMDSGYLHPLEPRSARNTTPTSYETFVAEE